MTLQQLKYVVEIEKSGSLSKAAAKLFVSQPNLSNAVKDLEAEFGITLFKRSNRGVHVTEKGTVFLNYARSVIYQCEEMKNISTDENSTTFRLIAQNYSPIMEAFVRFVKENSNKERIKHQLINAKGFDIIDKLYKQEMDLGIFLIMENSLDDFIKHLNDRNLTYTKLGRLSFYVNLRKAHPALNKKDSIFYELHKYPYVHYRENIYAGQTDSFITEEFDFVDLSKEIFVFDRDVKCKIVNETDAYGIGCKLHPNFSKYFDWELIPIPDVYAQIGYIHSKNHMMSIESQSYIEILRDELKDIII